MYPKEENSSIPLNDLSEASELSVSAIGLDLSHNSDNKLLFNDRKPNNINITFSDITYSVNSWSMNKFPFKRGKSYYYSVYFKLIYHVHIIITTFTYAF